jgi:DNA-directed RNA polymerase subunit H (RpoH/RPB5)
MKEHFLERISALRGRKMKLRYLDLVNDKINKLTVDGDTIYVIYKDSDYKKVIEKVGEHESVNFFHDDGTFFCPMDNVNVPKHVLVEDPEELVRRYENLKFPRILFEDPVVKWNGWECGSYVRIERGRGEIFYRHLYCSEHAPF